MQPILCEHEFPHSPQLVHSLAKCAPPVDSMPEKPHSATCPRGPASRRSSIQSSSSQAEPLQLVSSCETANPLSPSMGEKDFSKAQTRRGKAPVRVSDVLRERARERAVARERLRAREGAISPVASPLLVCLSVSVSGSISFFVVVVASTELSLLTHLSTQCLVSPTYSASRSLCASVSVSLSLYLCLSASLPPCLSASLSPSLHYLTFSQSLSLCLCLCLSVSVSVSVSVSASLPLCLSASAITLFHFACIFPLTTPLSPPISPDEL